MLPNSAPEGLLEVGRIGKPHGVRGDVFLSLTSDLEQRRSVGSELIIVEGGAQRTLTIATVRPQQDRWVVHFEGIDDRNAVEKLTNKYLYAEPIDGAEGLWVHQLIGSEVEDTSGVSWGMCTGVLNNPAHDLLELESGVLIPMPFVLSCDEGITVIDPPAGLREALLSDDSDAAE